MFNNLNFKAMKTNVHIAAVAKQFKNGQNGYEVKVEGLDGKMNCSMNFYSPLKAMRYCWMLSKRLELQIDTIQLTALSLAYQRLKDAETEMATNAQTAADELAKQVEASQEEDEPEVPVVSATQSLFPEDTPNLDTPIMKQFNDLKKKHPDALLLFRCGDFYETYEDDASACAEILGITLTRRSDNKVRMAGFPYHALDTYLPKLVRAGKRVAICDQIEDPKTKKATKRGITELVKPSNAKTEGAA